MSKAELAELAISTPLLSELQFIIFLIFLTMTPALFTLYMVKRVMNKYDHVRNNQPTKGEK